MKGEMGIAIKEPIFEVEGEEGEDPIHFEGHLSALAFLEWLLLTESQLSLEEAAGPCGIGQREYRDRRRGGGGENRMVSR